MGFVLEIQVIIKDSPIIRSERLYRGALFFLEYILPELTLDSAS